MKRLMMTVAAVSTVFGATAAYAGCNAYGCSNGGGCNAYGCWQTHGGGCNAYGCWEGC